jgi:NLR family CARD domain-containing protein 3
VYRGVSGVLPEDFWQANEHGVKGGVELGFMSTTTNRSTAIGYIMSQQNQTAKMLFEIEMGMIDRGAASCVNSSHFVIAAPEPFAIN